MKRKYLTLVPVAALLLSMLSACRTATADNMQGTFEDALENAAQTVFSSAPEQTRPQSNAATLTAAEAQAIALTHAGFTADQVTGLRSEYEIDDGIPHYDIRFRKGLREYEYEIHAQTGAVLSFDKDD